MCPDSSGLPWAATVSKNMPRDVDWFKTHSFHDVVPPMPSAVSLARVDLLLPDEQGPVAPETLMSCTRFAES